MPRDYLNDAATRVRREDRAVTDDDWMVHFLEQAAVGVLATAHDQQPFLNSNLFAYDAQQHVIYIHTARVGRTRSVVEQNPQAAFSVMQMGRMLPAEQALEFSVEYAGITAFGMVTIVEDEAEATHALQIMLDKYAPHLQAGADYRPPVPEELARTSVFRMSISEWSGKKKEVDAFPGAFWYPEAPILASQATQTTWHGALRAIHIAAERGGPMQAVEQVEAVAGKGLRGDHHFNPAGVAGQVGAEAQEVTLIAAEDLAAVQQESQLTLTAEDTRRNLLVEGVPLNHLVGKRFHVGAVILQGIELCEPCQGLAQSTGYGPKIISAMLHRGGLRAIILQGGTLHVNAPVRPSLEPER